MLQKLSSQLVENPEYLKDKRVLLRADLNVPLGENGIVDESEARRIAAFLPTLNALKAVGAKVIIAAHHNGNKNTQTLLPVYEYLKKQIMGINFVSEQEVSSIGVQINELGSGDIILLENIRWFDGEKKNEAAFSSQLGDLCDMYVNEAFSVSHRKHASMFGVRSFVANDDQFMGLHLEKELETLSQVRESDSPILLIGGAKFGTKLPLIEKFLEKNAKVFIGGALAHVVYVAKGLEIGSSLYDEGSLENVKKWADDPRVFVSEKVRVCDIDSSGILDPSSVMEISLKDIQENQSIVDTGADLVEMLSGELQKDVSTNGGSPDQILLWNGPLGWYEKGFTDTTKLAADLLVSKTKEAQLKTIIGGGDIVTALSELGKIDEFSFVSTGGGALLDYLVDGKLVALQ